MQHLSALRNSYLEPVSPIWQLKDLSNSCHIHLTVNRLIWQLSTLSNSYECYEIVILQSKLQNSNTSISLFGHCTGYEFNILKNICL